MQRVCGMFDTPRRQNCFIDGDRECLTQTSTPKYAKPVPFAAVEIRIHLIRGNKVMLDSDLAELYGVATKNLNKAFQRNRERFPADFVYQLTRQGKVCLAPRLEIIRGL